MKKGVVVFEENWLAADHPTSILEALRHRLTPRKWRLFCIACCRRINHLLTDDACQAALTAGEAVAEGQQPFNSMEQSWRECADFAFGQGRKRMAAAATAAAACACGPFDPAGLRGEQFWAMVMRDGMRSIAGVCAQFSAEAAAWRDGGANKKAEESENAALARVARDVFNPYRRVVFRPTWRTSDALAIARQAYDSCDFSAMPVLSDALQDAGCDDRWLLEHCRGFEKCPACIGVGATDDGPCAKCEESGRRAMVGPHVRGCWAVDLVLDRS